MYKITTIDNSEPIVIEDYFEDEKVLHSWNDKPAVINKDASKFWYQNGLLHRVSGPAIIWDTGEKQYYINNKLMNYSQWNIHPLVLKVKLNLL